MKAGDLVKKIEGSTYVGEIGIVIKVYNETKRIGYPVVEVITAGKLVKWAGHCVEKIA